MKALFFCLINSFYRFVLEPELTSVANGIIEPGAKFSEIPESPLLTLNMITPEGWLVETVRSNCDLDNIHLKDVSCPVSLYRVVSRDISHCDLRSEHPHSGCSPDGLSL